MELSFRPLPTARTILTGALCFCLVIVAEATAGVNAVTLDRPAGVAAPASETAELSLYRKAVERADQSRLQAMTLSQGNTVSRFGAALHDLEKETAMVAQGLETVQVSKLERTLAWLRERAGKDVWRIADVARGEIASTRSVVELARGRALEQGRKAVEEVSGILNREGGTSGLTASNSLPVFRATAAEGLYERRVAAAFAAVDARIAALEKSLESGAAAPR